MEVMTPAGPPSLGASEESNVLTSVVGCAGSEIREVWPHCGLCRRSEGQVGSAADAPPPELDAIP